MKKLLFLLSALCLFTMCTDSSSLSDVDKDLALFRDPTATSLKWLVSDEKIENMNTPELKELALALKGGDYSLDYRNAEYRAYLSPETLGKELSIGNGYSKYENVTGIFLPKGKHLIMVDGIAESLDFPVELFVPNWNRHPAPDIQPTKDPNGWGIVKEVHSLKNGVNIIDVQTEGLAYISYFSNDPRSEAPIKVHFANAQVNGYFDITKDGDDDWDRLLENSVYPMIDGKGRYSQIVYPVSSCEKYAQGRGVELLSNYDSLVHRQHRFLGLTKYNRVPDNRILARVNFNYYMFRDGDGVAYMGGKQGYAMHLVVDPERVISGDPCWGFNHEVGHVHQLAPYFNWGGLGEVSNNVVTLYGTTSFGNPSRLSEGKYYQKARESIIDKKISYLKDPDVFNRLVPFWQLHLYFSNHTDLDFYPDLHEALRLQAKAEQKYGRQSVSPEEAQLNFIKKACIAGKTDLVDFFEKWGFFKVAKFEIGDYGTYTYNMTKKMVDKCKLEIGKMNLSKPIVDISTMED